MDITIDCGPIETGVKHLFGGVVRAIMSPGGSIVASLENINGFLAVNTQPDDLIRTDFKQEGVVPKDRWSAARFSAPFFITDKDIKFLLEENPTKQSRLGILLVKKIFQYRVIRIHYAFGQDKIWQELTYVVGNKMHKAFPLPAIKFPLPKELPTASEDGSHCQKKKMPLSGRLHCYQCQEETRLLSVLISLEDPDLSYQQVVSELGKFKQWQFRMQQYLQHKHYALWEVIEFGDSYAVPTNDPSTTTTNTTSGEAGTKSRRTVTLTTEDMQKKKKNDATKKTKKNLLKQQYRNFRAEGLETLEHTFTRLSDLDTMSLDYLYNHLKVYETEVQKKTEPNTQNMAFISSAKHSRGNDEVNTASVYTASSNVPTASANVATKTRKKISIQGSDVAGFDKTKVECFNCHKMGHFAREYRAPRNQDRGRRDNYRQGSKAEEHAPKALMAIDGVGWDWSYMANDEEDHALKGLSWTGLPECADDTVTDYSRTSPTVESSSEEDQNRNPFVSENVTSPITPKPFVKFVKASDSQSKKCIVLGRDFKLLDDANILLRTLRQHNMYSIDLNNIFLHRDLTCLVAKASADELVDVGTNSTNFSGTKVDARQDVKKDVSSLRYIVLPNWVHKEHLESPSSQPQDACNTDAPESNGNSNPTATSTNPLANQLEKLTVETPIPTVSSPVPTVCFTDSQEPSSETRLI
nr:ribonuclease H-like domain-containing protein [Tanacetum cinerariifolium]